MPFWNDKVKKECSILFCNNDANNICREFGCNNEMCSEHTHYKNGKVVCDDCYDKK